MKIIRAIGKTATRRTLGADVVVQPFRRKGPWVQAVLEAVDDEGLAAGDDMQEYKLLEGGYALLIDLVDRDAIDEGKVGC